jgi:glycerophosphoryl diester phosphodiesterase
MEIGVDVIELDVHLTKDSQVVVCHDNNLKRLAGVDKKVSDLNYDVIFYF